VVTPLEDLLQLLDLEQIEVNIFRGASRESPFQRIFGGQVAGQALIAAGRTVPPDRFVHSLHVYFLRPGDLEIPVIYEVDRIRDGGSFTTRRVVAIQHGQPIFNLSASFHVTEDGVEHADPIPDVPAPETLPTFEETVEEFGPPGFERWPIMRSMDVRFWADEWFLYTQRSPAARGARGRRLRPRS
jgi:acyl-CoA thioesterase-2